MLPGMRRPPVRSSSSNASNEVPTLSLARIANHNKRTYKVKASTRPRVKAEDDEDDVSDLDSDVEKELMCESESLIAPSERPTLTNRTVERMTGNSMASGRLTNASMMSGRTSLASNQGPGGASSSVRRLGGVSWTGSAHNSFGGISLRGDSFMQRDSFANILENEALAPAASPSFRSGTVVVGNAASLLRNRTSSMEVADSDYYPDVMNEFGDMTPPNASRMGPLPLNSPSSHSSNPTSTRTSYKLSPQPDMMQAAPTPTPPSKRDKKGDNEPRFKRPGMKKRVVGNLDKEAETYAGGGDGATDSRFFPSPAGMLQNPTMYNFEDSGGRHFSSSQYHHSTSASSSSQWQPNQMPRSRSSAGSDADVMYID
mmetsp:Transcript_27535/g.77885  ORF Transcript_27535/g.77885 Transcript_27535/m.77885 type:complete len:371 (-) Transcript_27535:204-1316(-)